MDACQKGYVDIVKLLIGIESIDMDAVDLVVNNAASLSVVIVYSHYYIFHCSMVQLH